MKYWEDFHAGEVLELGSREVSREEIIDFARRYDPQPFHVDEEAARRSEFGGLIASGWHTCGLLMRMMVDRVLTGGASLGSPGVEEIRWLKPVRPGDVLRARATVTETRASASKPDRGIIRLKWEAFNQHDELVLTMATVALYGRRPAVQGADN